MAEPPQGSEPKEKSKADKAQIERFKKTAQELGVDETGAEFVRTLERIVPQVRQKKTADK